MRILLQSVLHLRIRALGVQVHGPGVVGQRQVGVFQLVVDLAQQEVHPGLFGRDLFESLQLL